MRDTANENSTNGTFPFEPQWSKQALRRERGPSLKEGTTMTGSEIQPQLRIVNPRIQAVLAAYARPTNPVPPREIGA